MSKNRAAQQRSNQFTDAQKKALAHHTGRMMVLAGAGSGKTAVLAQRCTALVDHLDSPCTVDQLLVVTFTIEAAGEMRSRITTALRDATQQNDLPAERRHRLAQQAALAQQAHVSTVHAFCSWVLRTWFNLCGVDPAFSVLDQINASLLWAESFRDSVRRRLQSNGNAEKFKEFFDLYAAGDIEKLRQLIEPMVNLLATQPGPDNKEWMDRVRADAGADQSLNKLANSVQSDLDELSVMLASLCDDAKFAADPKGIMAANLAQLQAKAAAASGVLQQKGFVAWDQAGNILSDYILTNVRLDAQAKDYEQALYFKESFYDHSAKRYGQLYKKGILARAAADVRRTGVLCRELIPTLLEFVAGVIEDYRDLKRRQNLLDFSDLERLTVDTLEKPDGQLADRLRRRFRHILFDEYQDINPLQRRLTELLSRVENPVAGLPPGSIFGVGDVVQSIYGFRGSRPELLQEQAARNGRDEVVEMAENFRTLPGLIDAFNLIFQTIFSRIASAHIPALRHGRAAPPENAQNTCTGTPVKLHVILKTTSIGDAEIAQPDQESADKPMEDTATDADADDDPIAELEAAEREAHLTAQMIKKLIGDGRQIAMSKSGATPEYRLITYEDIAVLMRSKKIRATQFVRILGAWDIPAFAEMSTGFFASPEILEVLDLLYVLDNPAQDIPLASVLLGSLGNFSHAELVRIRMKFPDRRKIAFHGAVPLFTREKQTTADDQNLAQRLGEFLNQVDQWRQMVHTLGVGEGLSYIYEASGLLSSIAAKPDGKQKLANLHLLRQKALEYSAASHDGLSGFAAFVRDLEQIDMGAAPIPAPGAVKVMSIHAAKGLEFPVVFLVGLGTKFNLKDLNQNVIVDAEAGLGLQVFNQVNGGMVRTTSPEYQLVKQARKLRLVQEEARLLYVAMTRARDELVLIGHADTGTRKNSRATFEELQNSVTKKWSSSLASAAVGRMLDWLGPIFAEAASDPANHWLRLSLHPSSAIDALPDISSAAGGKFSGRRAPDPNWIAMRAGRPLPESPPQDPDLQMTIRRITTAYPYQHLAELAAVTTVSKLKTALEDSQESDESPSSTLDPPLELPSEFATDNSGVQRGTAMHAILQHLDPAGDISSSGIHGQIQHLVSTGMITAQMAASADANSIAWFFTTVPGKLMREITMKKTAGDKGVEIFREQVFLWSLPPDKNADENENVASFDRTDQVLVRGAIDVLLLDGNAVHIIDYKTDVPAMIESRLPAYHKQVQYYARAAAGILHRPITSATLVFLSVRRCEIVDL
jgi:ATP-dependent helicase/nuclease subunit A